MKALVYLPIKPDVAKMNNLPVKLPVLAEDIPLITEEDRIPLDVIVRGLEAQVSLGKDDRDYYSSYLQYFYYEKFKDLLKKGDLEGAEEILKKAKDLGEDYRYHFYRGLLLREMKKDSEAEIEFKIASSMNDRFSLAHYELGKMYMSVGEYEDAEREFSKTIEKDSSFPLPYVKLGDVYLSEGKIDEALKMYKRALEVEKNLPDVYNRLGVIENSLQNFQSALKMFQKALEISPNYPDAEFNMAYTLTKLGKLFEALKILLNLEKRLPDDPMLLNELGILMRELGLFEDSSERLKRAYELSDDDGVAYNLARSLMFTDQEKAREVLESISSGELAQEARELMEYMDESFDVDFKEFGEIGEIALEISSCEDVICVVEGFEFEGEISERVGYLLDGYVLEGSDIDTSEGLEILAAYILSGRDFVDMERKSIEFATAVYGSGVMLGVARVILRLIQMRVKYGWVNSRDVIESVVPEIQDLDWNLSLNVSRSLEKIPHGNPKKGSDFLVSLLNYLEFGDAPESFKIWMEFLNPHTQK